MKYSNIFWGVILITLGVLIALRNLDIFFFSWHSIWRLWPLIFVFWGIAILPIKGAIKLILTVIAIIIGVLILANSPDPYFHWRSVWPDRDTEKEKVEEYPYDKQHFSEEYSPEILNVRLNLDAAAGDFRINGVTSQLFEMDCEGNTGPYNVNTKTNNNTSVIDIHHTKFIGRSNLTNDVWLMLNPEPVWKMKIDVGAAKIDMDLTPFKTEFIDIDGGASSIELKLGNKSQKIKLNIDAAAAGIKIRIPSESVCEVQTSTILSGKDLDGFNKIDRGLYQTPNFSDSANQIIISIDAAVSGLKIERY
ncbi:MAG: hypothetical protein JW731_13670 [Bacteroidales bacterium]|nr:hypothetical protein [Bacteroidales bacterium]